MLPQQRLEAGLEERLLARGGLGDLACVHVDPEDLMSEVSHADGMGEAEVSDPDDGDPRQMTAPPLDVP
jgi:hypothetical protein